MPQNINFQLLLVVAFFLFSFISWAVRKLAEQRAVKKQKDELQRRRLEALRTGSDLDEADVEEDDTPVQAEQPSDRDRLRELADRRRAQIEELQRRQRLQRQQRAAQQSSPAGSPGGAQASPTAAPAPPMPQIPQAPVPPRRPSAPARRPQPLAPSPTQQPPRVPARPQGRGQLAPQPRPTKPSQTQLPSRLQPTEPAARGSRRDVDAGEIGGTVSDAYAIGRGGGTSKRRKARITIEDVRQGVILREIIDPPVSMRDPDASRLPGE
ncbi:MAG: hypothetical protein AAGG07_09045 [Planctomycetota bacterium]